VTANVAKHDRPGPDFQVIEGGGQSDRLGAPGAAVMRSISDVTELTRTPIDSPRFRQVLGRYPTGVVVVTTVTDDGLPVGMTIGSFTSVSLSPPLVAFFPDKQSTTWPQIRPVGRFCVNVLAADQSELCRVFAAKDANRFDGLAWHPAPSGCPIIDGVLAWVDCEMQSIVNLGDHYLVTGLVRDLDECRSDHPLVFLGGDYGAFSPLFRSE